MDEKTLLFKELVRNGHVKVKDSKIWNIANRSFLYLSKELSDGFLNLIKSEVYKKGIHDNEIRLIKSSAKEFIKKIGTEEPFNLIDLGCGNGEKAKEFIRALDGNGKIRYCPISPSKYMADIALKSVKKEGFKNIVSYKPHIGNYDGLDKFAAMMRSSQFRKNVVLLFGSVIASYEINDYLFNISTRMFSGDYLIVGNGIREGERLEGIDKYKIKEFDNWFTPLISAMGLNRRDVEYTADFRNNRMESFYRVKKDKEINHKGKKIKLKKGDEILVFILYKYYINELENFFKMYFSEVDMAREDGEYVLALCKK